MKLFAAAMLTPWRAWPRIFADRRDGGWVYLAAGVDSLLMRPDDTIRAAWAVGRRGGGAIMPFLRLASLNIVWAIGLACALALFLRVSKRTGGFAFGELWGLTTWAYAPKLMVTALFAVLALDITWVYWVLSAGVVGVSVVFMLRAINSTGPLQPLAAWPVAIVVLLGAPFALFAQRAQQNPAFYKPVGLGDHIASLRFDGREITFPAEKPIVIDFWASWCGPCMDALPEWKRLRSDEVTLISANVEPENADYVRATFTDFSFVFAPPDLQARFQVNLLPTVIALSKDGDVVAYQNGGTDFQALIRKVTRQ